MSHMKRSQVTASTRYRGCCLSRAAAPLVLGALSLPISVFAAAAPDSSAARQQVLEEVIVTAQRREENLQETPISVSAFSVDALEQMGVHEAGQVAGYTPNLQINKPPGSYTNYGYSMRGLSSTDPSLLTEPTVGLYADGVYIARISGAAFELLDLERVEVLRGPQGTLYGRNTIGGAINVISKKPTEDFGLEARASVGNRDYQRLQARIDTGRHGDVAAKLSYSNWSKDGIVGNSQRDYDLGEVDESEALRLALRWTPTDTLWVDYVYDKLDNLSNGGLPQIVHARPFQVGLGGAIYAQMAAAASAQRVSALPQYFSYEPDTWSEIEGHALTAEWARENITLKSITSYREWDGGTTGNVYGSFPSDGMTVLDGMGGVVPEGQMVPIFLATRVSSQQQFTQELQIVGTALDDRLRYTAGVYYFEEQSEEDNPQTFVIPAVMAYGGLPQGTQSFLCQDPTFADPTACLGKDTILSSPVFNYGADNESVAVYGQFSYQFAPKWEATVGLRYTEDDKEAFLSQSGIIRNEGIDVVRAQESWSNLNPSFNLSYQATDRINTYATIATGYRSGGNNARATTSESFATPFDEENIISYELGMKSDWLEQRLRINAAVFHYVYDDKQVPQFVAGSSGASSIITNAGEQEATGFELELTALPLEGLLLQLAYGYLDIDINKFDTKPVDPVTGLPAGSENVDITAYAKAAHSPQNNGSAVVQYDLPPFSFGQLTLRADATYTDERFFNPVTNLYDSAGEQTLLNARITLSQIPLVNGTVRVAAWGKNLANKKYREWGIDFGALGYAIDSFQELRSYGLDLAYEF